MTLALAQTFHLGNARSPDPVVMPGRAVANRWAPGAVGQGLKAVGRARGVRTPEARHKEPDEVGNTT